MPYWLFILDLPNPCLNHWSHGPRHWFVQLYKKIIGVGSLTLFNLSAVFFWQIYIIYNTINLNFLWVIRFFLTMVIKFIERNKMYNCDFKKLIGTIITMIKQELSLKMSFSCEFFLKLLQKNAICVKSVDFRALGVG